MNGEMLWPVFFAFTKSANGVGGYGQLLTKASLFGHFLFHQPQKTSKYVGYFHYKLLLQRFFFI